MKRIAILTACCTVFAVLAASDDPSGESEPLRGDEGQVELRANGTYFGWILTRSGTKVRGFITWEPQNGRFIVTGHRMNPPVSINIPSKDISRLSFRELTEDEKKKTEDQNKASEAIRR